MFIKIHNRMNVAETKLYMDILRKITSADRGPVRFRHDRMY